MAQNDDSIRGTEICGLRGSEIEDALQMYAIRQRTQVLGRRDIGSRTYYANWRRRVGFIHDANTRKECQRRLSKDHRR